jgi:hypothetical protein
MATTTNAEFTRKLNKRMDDMAWIERNKYDWDFKRVFQLPVNQHDISWFVMNRLQSTFVAFVEVMNIEVYEQYRGVVIQLAEAILAIVNNDNAKVDTRVEQILDDAKRGELFKENDNLEYDRVIMADVAQHMHGIFEYCRYHLECRSHVNNTVHGQTVQARVNPIDNDGVINLLGRIKEICLLSFEKSE